MPAGDGNAGSGGFLSANTNWWARAGYTDGVTGFELLGSGWVGGGLDEGVVRDAQVGGGECARVGGSGQVGAGWRVLVENDAACIQNDLLFHA